MNSNRIADRIADLLKLTGFTEKNTIEELTDHYLTHIEEEVKRGLNSQRAVRETYQAIANINYTQFSQKKNYNGKWILLLSIILLGLAFYFCAPNQKISKTVIADKIAHHNTQLDIIQEIKSPNGFPIEPAIFDITSGFGFRIHPVNQQQVLHRGIDIKAKKGTPVLATGDGIVIDAGHNENPGKYIVIQHDGNYTTKYYHLSDFSVVKGSPVTKGQQIGKVGNSGLSFQSHLHYEILKNNVPVNPDNYIKP